MAKKAVSYLNDALRRYRSMLYLQQCDPSSLDRKSVESRWDHQSMVRFVAGRPRRTYHCCRTVLEVHAVIQTARLRGQEVESLDARDRGTKLDRWMEHLEMI